MNNELLPRFLLEVRNSLVEYDLIFLISAISYGIGISLILRWFYIKYGNAKTKGHYRFLNWKATNALEN